MNKKFKYLALFFSILFINLSYGQTQRGVILYKGSINQKFADSLLRDMVKRDIPKSHIQFSIDAYNNAREIELVLNIKDHESYYYYKPNLDIESGYNTTKGIVSIMSYYTDNSEDKIIEINKYVGNILHKPLKWKITKKTKKIGTYLCYQAIAVESLYSRKGYFYDEKVIAWFAVEISLNFGPKYYKGLPGLILEIQKGKYSIIATEINLNPDKEVKIKKPNLKKVITIDEANNRYKEMIGDRKKSK